MLSSLICLGLPRPIIDLIQSHLSKGPSININVHRNPNNVRKGEGGGGKGPVRIFLLTKTEKFNYPAMPAQTPLVSEIEMREIMTVLCQ